MISTTISDKAANYVTVSLEPAMVTRGLVSMFFLPPPNMGYARYSCQTILISKCSGESGSRWDYGKRCGLSLPARSLEVLQSKVSELNMTGTERTR